MSVKIVCPVCLRRYGAPTGAVGKSATCKPCGKAFQLQLLGHYQVLNELGAGAFGTVSRCFDCKLDRLAAVKVLQGKWTADAQIVSRFKNEARIMAKINHPHIVPLFDWGESGRDLYYVSALVDGTELRTKIPANGFEDPHRAVEIALTLLDALEYVHTTHQVWHRDIKPANIMMDERNFVYLLDFGIAACCQTDDALKTNPGTSLGTPAYMAPEQAGVTEEKVGPYSDQYSMGVVLYHMLTGHVPFEKPPPYLLIQILEEKPPRLSTYRPDLDPDLEAVLFKALEKNPKERYPSCKAFADALREWSAANRPADRGTRRMWLWAVIAVAVGGVAVLLTGCALSVGLGLLFKTTETKPAVTLFQEWKP
jgi:serine/threonine protein kinase